MKNLTIDKQLKISNRFKAQVIEDGRIVRETPWKNNLVLNQGRDALASNLSCNLFTNCAVGTGSSTPVVTQTGLDAEVKRSNTYLTGASNCGSTLSTNVLTHTRTFNFTAEISTVNYTEVGWSGASGAGANLNTRGLFGSTITVNSGQSLRVIYQFSITITPATARNLVAPISGWPALQYSLGASGNGDPAFSVISQTAVGDRLATGESFIIINGGTTGLAPGTYYVGTLLTSQFHVTATLGGPTIGFNNGTVTLVTNAIGNEQRCMIGLSSVNLDGTTNATGFDAAGVCCEPSVDANYIALSNYAGSLPAFGSPLNSGIAGTAFSKAYALQPYTGGTYYRDKQVQFLPSDGGSNRNDWLWLILIPSASAFTSAGYAFLFNHLQQKTNTATLTVTIRFSFAT